MIKEKELVEREGTHFRNGDSITLQTLQNELADAAVQVALPVAFRDDQIKFGGPIGSSMEHCVVLYHPLHKDDYNFYVFRINHQGKYAFLNIYVGGTSKLGIADTAKKDLLSGNMSSLSSYGKGAVVGSLIGSVLNGSLLGNKKKFEEERQWYIMVEDIIGDITE